MATMECASLRPRSLIFRAAQVHFITFHLSRLPHAAFLLQRHTTHASMELFILITTVCEISPMSVPDGAVNYMLLTFRRIAILGLVLSLPDKYK